jgi:glycosylphosphatidylinositol transamidase (GPIT) subunit GPI8
MTLKEKFENVEIMFESQIGSLKYDELSEASNQCEQIADDFAIEFAEWLDSIKKNEIFTTKQLLELFKKEKGL